MNLRLLVALVPAFSAALASADTNPVSLIFNGSFETNTLPPPPNGFFTTLYAPSTAITGWTVGGGSIDYIETYWNAQDGAHSIDLSGNSAGSISQTVTGLTVGREYFLSFWLAGNPDGPPDTKVAVASAGTLSTHYYSVTPGTRQNMNWVEKGFYFQAAGDTATISFSTALTDGNDTAYGPALDHVALIATPGPAGALAYGLGLLRRRRRAAK